MRSPWRCVNTSLIALITICLYLTFEEQLSHSSSTATSTQITYPSHTLHTTNVKVIYGATRLWQKQLWANLLDLKDCEHKNCISRNSSEFEGIEEADVVLFTAKSLVRPPRLPVIIRQRQHWVIMSYESSAYWNNRFPVIYHLQFNASMMYRKDSTIYYPWGKTIPKKSNGPKVNFAMNKSKGGFAYVSNCRSAHYERVALMRELSKHIDIDIYNTGCSGLLPLPPPCPRLPRGSNAKCEEKAHHNYHFFLAFENSLCKDYVTEKFWDRLKSPVYFLPVAMGGLSMEEYTSVAPSDSFLHVDNFTSVKALGEYMKYLTENDEAYNRYHQWRYDYRITTSRGFAGCDLCKLANEKPAMPAIPHIDQWFNDPSRCRTYTIH